MSAVTDISDVLSRPGRSSAKKCLILQALLVVAPLASGRAQNASMNDPVIDRIQAVGMDQTPLYRLSEQLFDSIGLGGLTWDYWEYTWHSNRDTPDKIVFDDLESNAKLVAMLAYLASEDPTTITRERIDLVAEGARLRSTSPRGDQPDVPTSWPACLKAPRSTQSRLK